MASRIYSAYLSRGECMIYQDGNKTADFGFMRCYRNTK
jgi:hypothetical protein